MITGKTPSGFKFSFDERILKDWRFANALADMQSSDDTQKLLGATAINKLLLGEDGSAKLVEHIQKKNDGFCPVDKVMLELKAIITANDATKN